MPNERGFLGRWRTSLSSAVIGFSRPCVSDDNAFVESLFRTAKYRPEFPASGGFDDLDQARRWASGFVHWYNCEHCHSAIGYVTQAQRHAGQDRAILQARHDLYTQARQRNPARWSGNTRYWAQVQSVTLNPEHEGSADATATASNQQPRAA